jgi:hypothetical protein
MDLLTQLLQQRLGILQVGGVEALGEPSIDLGEHRTRLIGGRFAGSWSRVAER